MKQKIYNNIDAVHYYEWTHCCYSSIFSRSILENRMLFWIDIIRFQLPQVLQVLLHYKYHWQLIQVYCHHKFIHVYYCYLDQYVSIFVFNVITFLQSYSITHPSYQVQQQIFSSHRISTILSLENSIVYSILLFIIKILLENTSITTLAERYDSCFLFTFLLFILWERISTLS